MKRAKTAQNPTQKKGEDNLLRPMTGYVQHTSQEFLGLNIFGAVLPLWPEHQPNLIDFHGTLVGERS